MRPEDLETLETLVDRYTLAAVLCGLSDICDLKADHINHDWQDEPLAHLWEQASIAIRNTAERKSVRTL